MKEKEHAHMGMLMGWFIVQAIIVLVIIWLGWRFYDRRYKGSGKSKGDLYTGQLKETSEVFIDPSDGRKYRVYYNPNTGERRYVPEEQ